MSAWWSGVFAGGFADFLRLRVVNRGEFVVVCVVKRGAKQPVIQA